MKSKYSIVIIGLLIVVIQIELFKPRIKRVDEKKLRMELVEKEEVLDISEYKTITIGEQTWMAENLKVKVKNSFSVNNNPVNDKELGRLYTWNAAMNTSPKGWRLPTMDDYEALLKNFNGPSSGDDLKIGGSSGFNASLPGYFDHNDSLFYGKGIYGQYWTSDQYHFTDCAWLMYVDSSQRFVSFNWYLSNNDGFSVRYIKE